jgi:malate:Na+ symporter
MSTITPVVVSRLEQPEEGISAHGPVAPGATTVADMYRLADMPWWFLLIFIGTVAALLYSDKLPHDVMGGFGLLFVVGVILGEIGDRLPYASTLLGGGPIFCIFGAALLVYWQVLPPSTVKLSADFMGSYNFLDFYIACIITGAMLKMNRQVFIGASLRLIPVLGVGMLLPIVVALPFSFLTGYGWTDAMLYVVWPVLGGGIGAGAVPLSQIYSGFGDITATQAMSRMMPAVVLSNLVSIIVAAQLDLLGRLWPATTGRGRLIRAGGEDMQRRIDREAQNTRPLPLSLDLIGLGFIVTLAVYLFATAIEELVFPSVHAFVWMIFLLTVVKMLRLFPKRLESAGIQWFDLWAKNLLYAVLAGVGIAFTDMSTVFGLVSDPIYLSLVVVTVLATTIGSGIAGHFVGLYFVESALAGGLGMAAMGQTGDIASLSAARRMELLPFTTLSTRLGGAIILLLAGLHVATIAKIVME